ncbi:hypothetical protein [Enterobacter mori]|uniref:hypothetical protein n=1 Tax=Enterobacter mori TaxID=539813 RepID=UPI003B83F767
MIYEIAFASAFTLALVSYWILCRRRTYEYQKKASCLIQEYFLDEKASGADKKSLYQNYMMLRKWYIFPFFALAIPFIFTCMLLVHGSIKVQGASKGNQKLYDEAFDKLMKMALSRNPLISAISIAMTGISLAILIPTGLLLHRIYDVPTSRQLIDFIGSMTSRAAKIAHIH